MKKRLILVAGNIGAGKTSLTERLGERLGWRTSYESVADNPYLSDFYKDMKAWSFHLQVFFLGHRAEQHVEAARASQSAILDRSIYEDFYIFARSLREMGNISEQDYHSYRRVFERVTAGIPAPDLLIYLRAPVEVLLARIQARGREMERGISEEYLRLLESYYDEWMEAFEQCPVLTIRTDDLDFVNKAKHLDVVIERIRETLAGKEEIVFTQD